MNGHYHRSKRGGGEWEFFDLPSSGPSSILSARAKNTLNIQSEALQLQAYRTVPGAGCQLGLVRVKNPQCRTPHQGTESLRLHRRRYPAAASGASVTHVDAQGHGRLGKGKRPLLRLWARLLIRWIVDDCVKFVEREIRRGNHYDGIIMDPPSYGRGPRVGKSGKSKRPFTR